MYLQVQLRLQQVVSAPPENRENLLKELEQFAFRGVPNLSSPRIPETLQSQEENPETQLSRAEDLQPVSSFCFEILLHISGLVLLLMYSDFEVGL